MISPEVITKVLKAIRTPADFDYFFDKLQSAAWIQPLRKEGLFTPPPPGDGASYGRWAPSEYLARMAPFAPIQVVETFEHLAVDNNPCLHFDCVRAALALPDAALAARLAAVEVTWIQRSERIWIAVATDHARLVIQLALAHQIPAARSLFRELFYISSESAQSEVIRRPFARLTDQQYEHLLAKTTPELATAMPQELLGELCSLLDVAIRTSRWDDDSPAPRDYSEIWRGRIATNLGVTSSHGLANILISAIRDVARKLADTNAAAREQVVQQLEAQPWDVFQRIAMQIIYDSGAAASDLAAPRILRRENFDNPAVKEEYGRLLERFFALLPGSRQEVVLGWIEVGPPNLDAWIEAYERETGQAATEEQRVQKAAVWKLGRVFPFRSALPNEWKERADAWMAQFGPPPPAGVSTQMRWGDASPKTAADLQAMDVEELVGFLRTWNAPNDWDGPSIHGLVGELSRAVADSAAQYALNATKFVGLSPEYVSAILDGIRAGAQAGAVVAWPEVLELSAWVLAQPREIAGRERSEYHPDRPHPGWKWTRSTIADMIVDCLEQAKTTIPFELRSNVWGIIEQLCRDPDIGSDLSDDPLTTSMNCTRGKAIHALFRYVRWVAVNLPRPSKKELRLERGLKEIPEVIPLLDSWLETATEPSVVVRSIYGYSFATLAAIDPEWAVAHREVIFPTEEGKRQFWVVAWDAYIRSTAVYASIYELLVSEYLFAVEHCGAYPSDAQSRKQACQALAEHIIVLLGRGAIGLEPDALLVRFFSRVPTALQSYALEFVGRSLESGETPPREVMERFVKLWDWLLVESKPEAEHGDRARLAAFGSWFTANKFDLEWSIRTLRESLRLARCVAHAYFVIETLVEHVHTYPLLVLQCLEEIIRGDADNWDVSAKIDDVKRILTAGLAHPDTQVQSAARQIIHDLGARGFSSVGELLRPPRGSAS